MGSVIEAISGPASGVIAIVDFIGKRLLEGLVVIAYMLESISSVEVFFTWAPSFIASILSTIVLIAVLFRILGWGD